MNHQDSRSVTTAGKTFSPTALALVLGLALLLPGAAALANKYADDFEQINTERVEKPDDPQKAGIAKAEVPPPDGPAGAPVNTSRSNKKASIAKAEEPPQDELPGKTGHAPKPVSPGTGPHRSLKAGDPIPGIPVGLEGDDTRTAPGSKGGDKKPGLAIQGDPIPGTEIGLEGDPEGIKVSAKTDSTGAFHFDKLPAGKYKLTLPGLPSQSLTVGEKGNITGVLSRQPNGTASISVNGPTGIADHGTRLIRITNVRANANALGKANQPIITKDVDNLSTQAKTSSTDGVGELPGKTAKPLQGTPVGLEGDPGSVKVSTTTGADGTFHFDKLPPGKYKLTLPGLSPQSLTVVGDGIAGGKVMRGSDDSLKIFDRWGKSVAKQADDDVRVKGKGAESPVSFGSGNAGFGGTGHGMGGGGITPPGAAMGGAGGPGPMGPGAGGPMGGSPGGAMRP